MKSYAEDILVGSYLDVGVKYFCQKKYNGTALCMSCKYMFSVKLLQFVIEGISMWECESSGSFMLVLYKVW